jgi:DNA helicase-2/ATP-dependent DNA helicase PcrA
MATDTPAQIEEERRLLYVAMTRAKDDLHLIIPQRFFTHQQASTGDRHVFASRTRFIPSGILDCFACSAWPAAHRRERSLTPSGIAVPIDLKSRMRGMWA